MTAYTGSPYNSHNVERAAWPVGRARSPRARMRLHRVVANRAACPRAGGVCMAGSADGAPLVDRVVNPGSGSDLMTRVAAVPDGHAAAPDRPSLTIVTHWLDERRRHG